MSPLSHALTATVLALGLAATAQAGYLENPDYPLSANEQLYADLFKLSPQERHKRLVEGATKEGKLEFIQTLGGALGRNNTKVFRDAHPFITVRETNLGTNLAIDRLVVEERAGQHITDVTGGDITESSYPLELGFLARYPTPATDNILPQYKGFLDKHHRWIVYAWLEKGISYNTNVISEADAPKSHFDLCNPKHKGNLSMEPARVRFLQFLQKMMGEEKMIEWFKCIKEMQPIMNRDASVRMELMLAGDHGIQVDNSFYVLYQRAQDVARKRGVDKVPYKMVLTTPIMAQPSGCVINRMANNPHASALFCDFLLGKEIQQFMYDNYRNPVTLPSPFMPKDIELITVEPIPAAEADRLHGLYSEHFGTRKG